MPRKTSVLQGEVIDKADASTTEEPTLEHSPEIIPGLVQEELPVFNVDDKLWRRHNGKIETATIDSVVDESGGTEANAIVDDGDYKGWHARVKIDDLGDMVYKEGDTTYTQWQSGVPPAEQQTRQTSEKVDPELLAQHLAMKMHDEGARFQGPDGGIVSPTGEVDEAGNFVLQVETDDGTEEKSIPPEEFIRDYLIVSEDRDLQPETVPGTDEKRWHEISRSDLRSIVDTYNSRVSEDREINLEVLEKEALANLREVNPVNDKLDVMEGLSTDEANQLRDYLEKLRLAATRKGLGSEDTPEVREYFEADLKSKREKLAELNYKRINSAMRMQLPKNREMSAEAQDEYDESLRALGRWELAGVQGDSEDTQKARQIRATELALEEMQKMRVEINSIEEPERAKTSKKRRVLGRFGLLATSVVGGIGARAGLGFVGIAGGFGALFAGGAVGGAVGAAVAGYRAQRDIKRGLDSKSSEEDKIAEKQALAAGLAQGQDIDEALKTYLAAEAGKAGKERRKEIRGRVYRGLGTGALIGAGGAELGYWATAGVEALGNALPDSWQFWNGDVAATDGGVEHTGHADDTSSGSDIVPESPVDAAETTPPTTHDLLQQYAGENTDAALTIENGEGPYQTLQELGIPEEKWDDLFNNDALMEKLVENGDAYSLQDAGVQEHGWGWTGNELSQASAGDLYDAAGMNTTDVVTGAENGLPQTYADISPQAQEFAQHHDIVTNIPSGMGGEELMKELGVDSDAWYAVENDLIKAAPNDFYTMNDGHVGLLHNGALSAGGVEELLKSLNQHGYSV